MTAYLSSGAVYLSSAAVVPLRAAYKDLALSELISTASSKCIEESSLGFREIEGVVLAASDLIDGRGITTMVTAAPAGAYLKDEIRVADDVLFGIALGAMRILSGTCRSCLVVAWGKISETDVQKVDSYTFEPFYHRPLGLSNASMLALQLSRVDPAERLREGASRVVVDSRARGSQNPFSLRLPPCVAGDVESSPLVASPLREMDLPPQADGACAFLLVDADLAKASPSPVRVAGIGWSTSQYAIGDRDPQFGAVAESARRAYTAAGSVTPGEDIQLAEVSEVSSYHRLLVAAAAGLPNEVIVNPSGGNFNGLPGLRGRRIPLV